MTAPEKMVTSAKFGGVWGATTLRAAACAALVYVISGTTRADEACERARRPPRLLPNAVQPAGASFEGYPNVEDAQKFAVARGFLSSTAREVVRHPVTAPLKSAGRLGERLGVRVRELSPRPGLPHARAADPRALGDLGGGAGGPCAPARITLLPSSEEALDGLLRVIASAQYYVDIMVYGWEDDAVGNAVADALIAAARRGVRVCALIDRTAYILHNEKVTRGCPTFADRLAATPGVTMIITPNPFIKMDHRKLAIVDGRIAWSGSMILTEVVLQRWRNLSFLAEGPIVAQYEAVFAERRQDAGGGGEPHLGTPETLDPAPNANVRLVRTDIGERSLKQAVYYAIDHAQRNIYLSNPYLSDEIVTHKLIEAARRGVDVRVVLTLRGNIRRLNQFGLWTANTLYKGGVRVWLYPAMTHVKAMSVDGVWAYLGTGNFDELSLRNNREVGLAINAPGVAAELDAVLFERDIAASEEMHAPLPPLPFRRRLKLEIFALWY